ncbi:hypothetical protein HAP94_01625 [Acidithiobacillus ferrivorans]|nr:hypothetical protein [Acidithiobacillus ferrivorans]
MSSQDFSEFVLTPAGNLDFGELPVDVAYIIGRQPGPIRLRAEDFQHIYNRHKQEISQQGYSSVTDFVSYIAQNYNAIYRGNRSPSTQGRKRRSHPTITQSLPSTKNPRSMS